MEPRHLPSSGWAKDSVEVESYVRGLARRRPDLTVTTLRFASFIGPTANTPMAQYFSMPVVPTVLGHDARLQLVHEDDGLEVLRRAAVEEHPGLYNVAGPGVIGLSQAIRRAGHVELPIVPPLVGHFGLILRRGGFADFSPEQVRLLKYGRALDTTRLVTLFGYTPRYSTVAAFDDFVRSRRLNNVISPGLVTGAETVAGRLLSGWSA
jgi:UDP-glucose 4-epimerase